MSKSYLLNYHTIPSEMAKMEKNTMDTVQLRFTDRVTIIKVKVNISCYIFYHTFPGSLSP